MIRADPDQRVERQAALPDQFLAVDEGHYVIDSAPKDLRYASNDVESSASPLAGNPAAAIVRAIVLTNLTGISYLEDTEMLNFRVEGPFDIERKKEVGGRIISRWSADTFWSDDAKSHLADAVGCYVFGFRAAHGLVPVYVGQSKTGFKHECFQDHKITHYNNALIKKRSCTPIMFFVVKDEGARITFESFIGEIEHFLIQNALARNPWLENVQKPRWNIQGVYLSKPGKPSESALQFRSFLGISVVEGEGECDDDTNSEEAAKVADEGTPSNPPPPPQP